MESGGGARPAAPSPSERWPWLQQDRMLGPGEGRGLGQGLLVDGGIGLDTRVMAGEIFIVGTA